MHPWHDDADAGWQITQPHRDANELVHSHRRNYLSCGLKRDSREAGTFTHRYERRFPAKWKPDPLVAEGLFTLEKLYTLISGIVKSDF